MATLHPLPARNERSAPKWDSKYEEQLPTFFEEFKTVAKAAGIDADDVEMKKGVLRYADPELMRFWRTLPTFKEVAKTWAEFKKEVLSHYPGALEVAEATTEDLKKVVSKFAKSGISNSKELITYHRKFSIFADSLQEHGILSGVQVASFYMQAFPDSICIHLDTRLQVSFPKKVKGQAYSLTELREAIDFLLSDTEGDDFYVAKESSSIRGLNALIGERAVHCVADSGCSIVAMSDTTSNALGLSFNPKRRIPLQSANGKTDWTLGVAKDVPFRFGEIISFLQVHIVESPAYDVLLGHPFEILTQAHIQNFLSGDQHYTLTDPNTDKVVMIPTIPRELPRFRKEEGRDRRV
ncbi:hypothetical protein BT96DRAFT_841393 [Gymnopus androsaceus JB14]|uniref:Uncharacterized protein n=1 Tax=Gymnopus androsaceus JB14 TaxID=1447944 RepID=A0A6A4GH99_9AGAR|nr:hypothetical protein BT96DRAFT_841393 [Gymnopus androsaceus JB14]